MSRQRLRDRGRIAPRGLGGLAVSPLLLLPARGVGLQAGLFLEPKQALCGAGGSFTFCAQCGGEERHVNQKACALSGPAVSRLSGLSCVALGKCCCPLGRGTCTACIVCT